MNSMPLEKPTVMIVTVLYGQPLEQTNVFHSLLDPRERVYIHDNSPVPSAPESLPSNWTYVSDPSNPGLSAAYNAAAAIARSEGIDWLLIADQDTAFPEGMLTKMRETIASYPGERVFLPVVRISNGQYMSPVKMHGYVARLSEKPLDGVVPLNSTAAINSGLMVRTDAFWECGGYNEKVPLDFSDFQFLERLGGIVPKARVANIILRQSFSDKDDDAPTKLKRFERFCRSLGGFESKRQSARRDLRLVAIKRMLSLMVSTRSMKPMKIFRDHFMKSSTDNTNDRPDIAK